MMHVRCGSGFGDSLYLRPVAEYLAHQRGPVVALSDYPDVFIGARVTVEPFRRHRVDVVAHYVGGKSRKDTTQWQDVLQAAGIPDDVPLRFPWKVRNQALVEGLQRKAAGRPIVLVHGGRAPMDRNDGFGLELLPTRRAFDLVLGELAHCYRVQVGRDTQIYPLACDANLNGSTTVADVLDVAAISAGVVAQCSFAIPLAEALEKPLLAIWSARAEGSREGFIRTATPQKILSKPSSSYVMDGQDDDSLRSAVWAWRARHLVREVP